MFHWFTNKGLLHFLRLGLMAVLTTSNEVTAELIYV